MAVTINEMHVDVKGAAPPAAAAPSAEPKKDINLHQALELIALRNHRLRVD